MARIRTVKPNFFTSRAVKRLTDRQKLVWIGLWPNADDAGRLLDEPGILAGSLWALGLSEKQIDRTLSELHDAGRVVRYVIAGEKYLQVTNWTEHQKISKPSPSPIPPPPFRERSGSVPGGLPDGSRGEGKGRERKGGETPPSGFCENHPGGTSDPCMGCGDARRARVIWEQDQKMKPTPTPRAARSGDGHEHVADENGYCPKCGDPA